MSRDPFLLLEDIEKSCTKVVRYTESRSKDDVSRDHVRLDTVPLNLHVIGEAVKKLPAICVVDIQRWLGERLRACETSFPTRTSP